MRFINNSINKKLSAGFGLCVLLMVVMVGFNFAALQKLENLYHATLKRSLDMELATHAQHIGEDLDRIVGNAAIIRDLPKTEREWARSKRESLAIMEKMAMAADTPEEHAKVGEAGEAISDIIRIFEQQMLPLIRAGAPVQGAIAELDVRIDKRIDDITLALGRVAESMSAENLEASGEFRDVLRNTVSFGLTISFFGVVAALFISTLTTRRIIGPLAEITSAALEMKQGNYLVELKHQSNDELGVLTAAFRDMLGQVERRSAELQGSNERLQQEIFERRQAEEEVCRLNAELEQRVAERTSELVRANEQLKQVIATQERVEKELLGSREELRSLTAHLQSVREEERTRISREIHDELGQALTAMKLDVSWLGKKMRKDQPVLIEKTRAMTALIDTVIKTVQRISAQLRPGMLDDLGLREAIEWEAKEFQSRTEIACEFTCDPADMTVDRRHSTAIFRIVQEALTNIARHARASMASIHLVEKGDMLLLSVSDNGSGIPEKYISDPKSFGLIGIRERARLCGGTVKITGSPQEGTVVQVTIPLDGKEGTDDQDTYCR